MYRTARLSRADQRLAARSAWLHQLVSAEVTLLASLKGERQHVHLLLTRRDHALQELEVTRAKMIGVVRSLRHQLALDLFPVIGSAFQGGAHMRYGRWGVLFLHTIRAPVCRWNEVVMIAWQLAEFTQAAWNPLATPKPMPGSTEFNSAGVRTTPRCSLAWPPQGLR
jgi:hypothetical protein